MALCTVYTQLKDLTPFYITSYCTNSLITSLTHHLLIGLNGFSMRGLKELCDTKISFKFHINIGLPQVI